MKKSICILKFDFNTVGGAENVAIKLSNELNKKYNVHLVSITSLGDSLFFNLDNDVKSINFFYGNSKIYKLLYKGSKLLREYLIENNITTIIAIGISANPFMVFSTIGLRIKKIFCEHVNRKFSPTRLTFFNRISGVLFANYIVTLTEVDRNDYLSTYKFLSPKNVRVIPNWIDKMSNDDLKINYDDKKIITVTRISEEKGIDNLVSVAEKILSEYDDWTWDVYGDGKEYLIKKLKKDIITRNLQNKLILRGVVKNQNKIYPGHSIFVLTSYAEGLPLVLLEAQKYSIPIISFDCHTGPRDIIEDKNNGFLITNFDVNTMYDRLKLLIEDTNLRTIMGENSYIVKSKFDKKNILNKWFEII